MFRDTIFFRARFIILFVFLLVIYLMQPLEGHVVWNRIRYILFTLFLLSAVFSVCAARWQLIVAFILAVPAILMIWISELLSLSILGIIGFGLNALFLLYTAVAILIHVMCEKRVTSNTIFASLCVYFLIGVIWSMIYMLIEGIHPGSFRFATDIGLSITSLRDSLGHFMYYSFVTMTTLGYGDITPVNRLAGAISSLEAVVGQIYLVVLVARMVALHIAPAKK